MTQNPEIIQEKIDKFEILTPLKLRAIKENSLHAWQNKETHNTISKVSW